MLRLGQLDKPYGGVYDRDKHAVAFSLEQVGGWGAGCRREIGGDDV